MNAVYHTAFCLSIPFLDFFWKTRNKYGNINFHYEWQRIIRDFLYEAGIYFSCCDTPEQKKAYRFNTGTNFSVLSSEPPIPCDHAPAGGQAVVCQSGLKNWGFELKIVYFYVIIFYNNMVFDCFERI